MSQSTSCLGTLMKVIAAFLAILVILILPFSILTHDIEQVIFSPEILGDALTESFIDTGLFQRVLAENLPTSDFMQETGPEDIDVGRAFESLSAPEWEAIIEFLLPPQWVGIQIKTIVQATIDWLDTDQAIPHIVLDLRPIKGQLLGGGMAEVVDTVVDSWPSCMPEQVEKMSVERELARQTPILYCEPPEPFRSQLIEYATSQLEGVFRQIPPEFALFDPAGGDRDFSEIKGIKSQIRLLRAFSRSGWLIPISFIGMIMALAIRSWGDLARWWGIPLLLAGILTLILGLALAGATEVLISSLFSDIRQTAQALYFIARVSVESILDEAIGLLLGHVLLLVILGLVLLFSGWLMGRRTSAARAEITGTIPPPPSDSVYPPVYPTPPPPVTPIGTGDDIVLEDEDPPSGVFG